MKGRIQTAERLSGIAHGRCPACRDARRQLFCERVADQHGTLYVIPPSPPPCPRCGKRRLLRLIFSATPPRVVPRAAS